jgi:Anaphase-promoting complex APC subunit CDC26
MLRRKPTALTITSEDIASFEAAHAERIARLKFLKTGGDPLGLFTNTTRSVGRDEQRALEDEQVQAPGLGGGTVDPNDELKPLPGDKARIVRGREERIVGVAGSAGGGRGR